MHARAFTFHSLASHVYGLCPDDSTLFELVDAAKHGRIAPRATVEADHLLLDEMQDCRELYFALLRCVFPAKLPHSLLCGDREQMLYDFEEDDPATLTYLDEPARHFGGGDWTRTRLATSFRLTPPLAALVNGVKDGERLAPGNLATTRAPAVVVTCGMFQWVEKLMPHLLELLRHYPLERVAVLVRSVRGSSAGVRTFVNAITSRQIPVYVHGVDSPVGRAGKLTVCTYYAAKGLTFDATLVVGLSETTAPNPMYVALSRARCAQVVALDRFRPPRRVLRALAQDLPARLCPQTRLFVQHGYDDPPEDAAYEPSLRDLTGWAPRGRAPELHEAVQTTTTSFEEETQELPTEVRTTAADGLVDEISKLYVLAALCAEEHRRTGRCARLRYLNNPVRATANERKRKLREEEDFHDRIVDSRARRRAAAAAAARSCARRCCTSRTRRAGGSRSRRPSSRAASTTTWLSDCCRRSSGWTARSSPRCARAWRRTWARAAASTRSCAGARARRSPSAGATCSPTAPPTPSCTRTGSRRHCARARRWCWTARRSTAACSSTCAPARWPRASCSTARRSWRACSWWRPKKRMLQDRISCCMYHREG